MKNTIIILIALLTLSFVGCDVDQPNSDQTQQRQQEQILKEGTAAVGMPAIHNFREKKLLKDILEMRDQDGLTTYTYIVAEQTGKLIFLGESIGYGIPYATQFTNPNKVEYVARGGAYSIVTLPQADPNGLFSPASCDGTWVLLKDPHSNNVKPIYVEPRIIVSPFKLD